MKIILVPDFVQKMLRSSIPFASSGQLSKEFNYIQELKDSKKKSIDSLPETLKSKLYDFQKEGIEFGIKKFGRLILGDEMGVGKTIQAIGIAYLYKQDWPLLIITPSSLKYIWRDEITKWLKF